jgi:hypothetical protein
MIVCKYLVAWGTTPDRAKIREAPAPASRRALTCAQANRRVSVRLGCHFLHHFEKRRKESLRIQHRTRDASVLDQL